MKFKGELEIMEAGEIYIGEVIIVSHKKYMIIDMYTPDGIRKLYRKNPVTGISPGNERRWAISLSIASYKRIAKRLENIGCVLQCTVKNPDDFRQNFVMFNDEQEVIKIEEADF